MNNFDEVVGGSSVAGSAPRHAFLYSGGVTHDLGTLGGNGITTAFGINDAGQIVGSSFVPGQEIRRAFLYTDGLMVDLNDLIAPNSLPPGNTLHEALGINSSGQIIANSLDNTQAYLLSPVAPLSITGPTSLPGGIVGTPYGPVSFAADGGAGGNHWSATGLPVGLAIDATTGVLSGTPEPGTQAVYPNARFTVTDSAAIAASVTLSLTINSAGPAPPAITSVSPNTVVGSNATRNCASTVGSS
jgi:probable HAF family extracellular repeat protein